MAVERDYEQALPVGFKLIGGAHEYIIEQVLGQGGFGITYKVKAHIMAGNIRVTTHFAVKEFFPSTCWRTSSSTQMLYPPTLGEDINTNLRDFINEGQRLQRICSINNNIVQVNEVFEANGTAYFVMEYLNGGDLRAMVKNNGDNGLSVQQMLNVMVPIGNAIQCLHDNNLLHLDIKPDNIVMRHDEDSGEDVPVIIDFGIAVHFDNNGSPTSRTPSSGISAGYSPIEQYSQLRHFDPRLDVYAFSATCLYALTGQDPVEAIRVPANYIRDVIPAGTSENIIEALERGMCKDLHNRTTSINELLMDLQDDAVVDAVVESGDDDEPPQLPSARLSQLPPQLPPQLPIQEQVLEPEPEVEPAPIQEPVLEPILEQSQMPNQEAANQDYKSTISFNHYDNSGGNNAGIAPAYSGMHNNGNIAAEAYNYNNNSKNRKPLIIALACIAGAVVIGLVIWGIIALSKSNSRSGSSDYEDYDEIPLEMALSDTIYCDALLNAASDGDAQAQNILGECYFYGKETDINYEKAVEWYKLAAEQGNADAQYSLGYCYQNGQGVEQDIDQAVQWYRYASDQGVAVAQNELGKCYSTGEGVEQDYKKAFDLFQEAANQDLAEGHLNLGLCYFNGDGVTKNHKQAFSCFSKAAELDLALGKTGLGYCYQYGYGVAIDYNQAVEWYKLAAEQGEYEAQFCLAQCYENGIGVEKDLELAIEWYKLSAEQGFQEAINALERLNVDY